MFKRLKNAWRLSKVQGIEYADEITLRNTGKGERTVFVAKAGEPLGNGDAVFFGEGTEKDYDEFQKEETGMKGWYDRLKNL